MEYFVGLDLGTNSVGWAVTDDSYRILRKKGKDMWGIREFERAETAAARRTNRTNRRRLERSKARIGMLESLFSDEIEKFDPNFFMRLANSKFLPEDKDDSVKSPNGIFDDKTYQDKDYFAEYPTIFHLRKELIDDSSEHDVRLVYLALLNMFKHRGNFLNASISDEDEEIDISVAYDAAVESLSENYGITLRSGCANEIKDVLADSSISRTSKKEKLTELLDINAKNKPMSECIKLLSGLKSNIQMIFALPSDEEKIEISFTDSDYDEKMLGLRDILDDTANDILANFKIVYDAGALAGIMKNYKYLSYARVDAYEKHKSDLKLLKAVYHKYADKTAYNRMFRNDTSGSYSAYVNSFNSNKKLRRNMSDRKKDNLYAVIKKDIKAELKESDSEVQYIYDEMAKMTFLPKQLTSDNGVIPNQVHLKEMRRILSNAEGYLPFLKEQDESGLSVSEKIIQLFKFQIPFYIGPTSEQSQRAGGNGWVIRKESGRVLPWNMEQKIDTAATAQRFIERMLRDCTYLTGEKAMPKASLDYEKYSVLNEINNLRYCGERIDVQLKQDIYRDLFLTGKKVTRGKLEKYLLGKGLTEIDQISGIDTNLNNYLSSYGKLTTIFGEDLKLDSVRSMAENIIYLATVFGSSKKMFKQQLMEKYSDRLTKEQIKRLLGLKFNDWGRFSKAFLELKGCDKSTGEVTSVLKALWDSKLNLMELLNSDDYTFKDELASLEYKSIGTLAEITHDDLDGFYFSNPVKRMIWQTMLVLQDIQTVMGCAPDKIFIEMTREDQEKGDKGRKDSRKKQLLDLYKNISKEDRDWADEIEKADKNGSLRSKKIYLYYTQMGKCMYTGEPIDFENLLNANSNYDIDHIYPRHFVKDNSLGNNLVLVKKESNAYKSDSYPIIAETRCNPAIQAHWKTLLRHKLISEEKYRRLTCGNSFTEKQMAGFIARQLVETSQSMKGVADILKQILPDTTIVYSKGSNVSDFRKDTELHNNFLKSRLVNEFHHAQDAYLNIVVGNVYYTKFTQNPLNYIRREYNRDRQKYNYNLNKMYKDDIIRDGYCAWKIPGNGEPGTIDTVRKMMSKNTPIMTRLCYEETGELFNLTIYGKAKAKEDNYVPIKTNMPVTKYGGYTSLKPAYFIFVEYGPEKKRQKAFDVVHTYYAAKIKNEDDLLQYAKDILKLENPRILASKLKKYSLLKLDGYYMYLVGMDSRKNVELHNAVNICFSLDKVAYIHDIEKSLDGGRLKSTVTKEKNEALYEELIQKHKNSIFSKNPKPLGSVLEKGRNAFTAFDVFKQCEVLVKLLNVSGIETKNVDLKEIGGATDAGRLRISGNMSKRSELYLVNQSASGLFSKETDLLNS